MKVGFTGTQIGMSNSQMISLRQALVGATEFHHGDCVGADEQADKIARTMGIPIIIHPPDDDSKRAFCFRQGDAERAPRPYLDRNHDIVDWTELLIAAPKDSTVEELRSGTWATVRYARKKGRRIMLLHRRKVNADR